MIDINECDVPTLNSCDENADCFNFIGGFNCSCKESYFGDGFTCLRKLMKLLAIANTSSSFSNCSWSTS